MSESECTLVEDPGHGGYDSGANGPGGTQEKDVNLAVGLLIREKLKNYPINLTMTRESDEVSWPSSLNADLQARCDIANNLGANIFLSLHCDSFSSPEAEGTTAYCLKLGGEGERLARCIHEELLKVPEVKDGQVKAAHDELVKAYGMNYEMFAVPDHGLKEANFYVLRNTDMPAALIEMAFISNPDEEQLLADLVFQEKLAEAIVAGILKYFVIQIGKDMGHPAYNIVDTAYVPLRGILRATGIGDIIGWDPNTSTATFTTNGKTYAATMGSSIIREVG